MLQENLLTTCSEAINEKHVSAVNIQSAPSTKRADENVDLVPRRCIEAARFSPDEDGFNVEDQFHRTVLSMFHQ